MRFLNSQLELNQNLILTAVFVGTSYLPYSDKSRNVSVIKTGGSLYFIACDNSIKIFICGEFFCVYLTNKINYYILLTDNYT